MNRAQARKSILSLSEGQDLDALIASLIVKEKVYPLFYWDSHLGAGKCYPFSTSRFRLMLLSPFPIGKHPDADSTPLYVRDYSSSLDTVDHIMHKLGISLRPSRNRFMWVAKSGKYEVAEFTPAVAVCKVALLKVLHL